MSGMILLSAPNDGPVIERVWMFVSRDKDGNENVMGSLMGRLGTQPLITGNPRILDLMKPLAAEAAQKCEGTGQTVHLISFSNRDEVEGWR
jgi:hypothetical protein